VSGVSSGKRIEKIPIENIENERLRSAAVFLHFLWVVMRKPHKHEFGRMLKERITKLDLDINHKMHVVDGGWLLHQIKWTRGATIRTIITTYVKAKFKDSCFQLSVSLFSKKSNQYTKFWPTSPFFNLLKK
jgi:hypothetical protein